MPLQSKQIAYITAGVALTAGLGYLIYFDHKRRHDPQYRKQLKKERKKQAKKEKVQKEVDDNNVKDLIDTVVEAANQVKFPTDPEAKEKYFMEQVGKGEALCAQGPSFFDQAVLPFYLALKVYPAPLELIMIYQKTVPEPIFQILVTIMAKEQNNRVNAFYEQFPDPATGLKLGEIPVGTNPEGKTIVRRSLVATQDFAEGDVLFSEDPLVSAVHPGLEGKHCHHCLKSIQDSEKVACDKCTTVVFCSSDCQKAAAGYHKYLCGDEKDDSLKAFLSHAQEQRQMYPLMVAQFLSSMVAEETERARLGEDNSTFTSWDHVDRFRYLDIPASPSSQQEIKLLNDLLGPKVQGISEFLSDQTYLMLKGKLLYNAYAIATAHDPITVPASEEHARAVDTDGKHVVGAGLYKLATYLGQAKQGNSKVVFDKTHKLTVIATKAIAKDDEVTTHYTLPVKTAVDEEEEPKTDVANETDEKPAPEDPSQAEESKADTTVQEESSLEPAEPFQLETSEQTAEADDE
ncbi:MAS20-domain-containing protein [Hesseltinella vesiculosa]|uniref:MAS20-domain-containing protein n=1 Tax=Hesseltinella vesiculosa TaxID=101127 RepID=A0A1X2GGE2_9FUNG|nr:MAS20-domain-containing protein [Hesseltinella vesiculosa]